jgi:hypothetical protein
MLQELTEHLSKRLLQSLSFELNALELFFSQVDLCANHTIALFELGLVLDLPDAQQTLHLFDAESVPGPEPKLTQNSDGDGQLALATEMRNSRTKPRNSHPPDYTTSSILRSIIAPATIGVLLMAAPELTPFPLHFHHG